MIPAHGSEGMAQRAWLTGMARRLGSQAWLTAAGSGGQPYCRSAPATLPVRGLTRWMREQTGQVTD